MQTNVLGGHNSPLQWWCLASWKGLCVAYLNQFWGVKMMDEDFTERFGTCCGEIDKSPANISEELIHHQKEMQKRDAFCLPSRPSMLHVSHLAPLQHRLPCPGPFCKQYAWGHSCSQQRPHPLRKAHMHIRIAALFADACMMLS